MRPVWSIRANSVRTNSPTRNCRFDRSSLPFLLREADRPGEYIADSWDEDDDDVVDVDAAVVIDGATTKEFVIDGAKAKTSKHNNIKGDALIILE